MEIPSRLLNRVVDGDFIPGFQVGDGFGGTLRFLNYPLGMILYVSLMQK